MPVILVQIDATNNASAGIRSVAGDLGTMAGALANVATGSERAARALAAQETAISRLESAQQRASQTMTQSITALTRAEQSMTNYERAITAVDKAWSEYQAMLNNVDAATGRTVSTQAELAAKLDQIAGLGDTVDTAFNAMTTAQDRAASSASGLTDRYSGVIDKQNALIDSTRKAEAELNKSLSGGGTSGGHGGSAGGGGGSGGYLFSMLGYQLAYSALSQLSQGFQQGLATQRTLAMTGATTGISPATQNALSQYVMQTGASGTQPFSPDVLSAGLYPIPSAGITDPKAIKAINDQAVKFSAFSGATDTGTEANALIQTMSAYGVTQSQMAGQAKMYQDAITAMVNLGIVQPAQVPASVTTFSTTAARNRIPFDLASGMFAASTYTTRSAQQSAQDQSAFLDAIAHPQLPARQTAAMLHITDLFGTQGLTTLGTDPKKYLTELENAVKLNPGLDLPKLFGQVNASDFVSGLLGPGGQNLNRTMGVIGATSQSGTTQAAFAAYEKSPAAQFDNSVAAFKTAEQQFAEAATPLATALVGWANSGVKALTEALDTWGKKTPANPAGGTPFDTLGHLINPGDKAFGQWQTAADEAARQAGSGAGVQTRSTPVIGGLLNANDAVSSAFTPFGDFLRSHLPGGTQLGTFLDIKNTPAPPPSGGTVGTSIAAAFADAAVQARRNGVYVGGGPGSGPITERYGTPVGMTGGGGPTYVPPAPVDQHAMQLSAISRAYQTQQANAALAAEQAMVNQKYGPGALTGGAGGSAPMAVTAAAERVATALNTFQGKNTVESALGSYVQAVNESPLLTALRKSSDIASETQKVARYERGMAGGPDQTLVQAAQQNLDAAVQMGDMPDKLKGYQDAYLAAERKLYEDTKSPQNLAAALRTVNQQAAVYSYQNQGIDLNRGIKDLQNAVSIDKLTGNSTAQLQAEQALLAYQTKNAGVLKLDKSDLALLAAQYRQDLIATYPVKNIDPFFQTNQRLGNFEAGAGSTLVRGGGSIDPTTTEIRRLQAELNTANKEIVSLLTTIARNSVVRAQAAAKSGAASGRYSTAP